MTIPELGRADRRIYVIDTSSVCWIRQGGEIPVEARKALLTRLDERVNAGDLVYPREVVSELRRFHDRHDQLLSWAIRNEPRATRHGTDFDAVKEVLAQVPTVLDHDKINEEADPYVLGLALSRQGVGELVTVVNEERKDRPDKLSITTACGLLGLVALPMSQYLRVHSLWPMEPEE